MPVSNQVTNIKGTTPGILSDILANRPAPGFTGLLFAQTDGTYGIYRDTGTAWVLIASGSGGSTPTLQNVLTAGNVATLSITATSFITTGGTSSQFVKGDGSLDSNVYLPKNNPAYTGVLTTGTQLFTPANALISVQSSVNSYNQIVLINTSSGAAASTDFIVGNNNSTDTTYYGDFGMNSSGFVGSGNFNTPNTVYLYSYSADLSIGTFTSNAIHFIVNNGSSDALTINTSGQLNTPNQITALKYIVSGASSTQFLKGDGSLDGTTYLTAGSAVTTFSAGTTGFTPSTATSGAIVLSGTLNVANGGTGVTTLAALASNTAFSSLYQGLNTNLTSLSGLTYASLSFVKMTAAGTFALDTNTYLTAGSAVSTFSAGTTGFTPSTATSGAIVLAGTLNVANGGTGVTTLAALASNTAFSSLYQGLNTNLTSLSGLTYASLAFVKMSAAGTFSLDTNTYITTGSAVTTFSAGTTGFTPSTATSGAIVLSGILNVSNGGTGVSSLTSLASNTAFSSVYVPYTGATASVNIGSNSFTAGSISGTSGVFTGIVNTTAGNGISAGGNSFAVSPSATRGVVNINGSTDQFLVLGSNGYLFASATAMQLLAQANVFVTIVSNGVSALSFAASSAATFAGSITGQAISGTTGTFTGLVNTTAGNGISAGGNSFAVSPSATRGVVNINGSTDQFLVLGSNGYLAATATTITLLAQSGVLVSIVNNASTALAFNSSNAASFSGRVNVNGATDSASYQLNVTGVGQIVQTQAYALNTTYFAAILSNSLTGSSNITNSSEVTISSGLDALGITTSGTNTLITATLVAATISRLYVNGTGGSWTRLAAWSGNIEVGGGTSITDAACLYTGVPYQQTGQSAYSGTITNYYGLLIEDITTNTNISAKITNKYGIYQRGASDINFFNGAIQLGTGNTLSASTTNTITNKIKIIVNGTTLYILASTSSA